jgi:hypothetical protein
VIPREFQRQNPAETMLALEDAGLPRCGIHTMSPGSLIGDLIQDRRDRERARKSRRAPRRLPLTFLLREETLKAMERARELGFTEEQILYAAPAAVLLRKLHGPENVTKRLVREHCERKYPHVFDCLSREQAA